MVQSRNPRPLALALIVFLAACGLDETPEVTEEAETTAAPVARVATSGPLAKDLFGFERTGSSQRPEAIGGYANGCQAGGIALAETGPTWQAMR
ncbi:MAG: hypothetical protein AAF618_06865, partial [Pseudomonadota bacterium]